MDRRTVQKYHKCSELPQKGAGKFIVSSVSPYLSYLAARWQAGYYNQRQLWLEIQLQGYTGSMSSVYRALKHFTRPEPDSSESKPVEIISPPKLPQPVRRLSARRACWILLHDLEKLKSEDLEMRKTLLKFSPVAVTLFGLSQKFKEILKNQQVEELENWLKSAEESGLKEFKGFAASLRGDYEAVKAGVRLEFSNGQTEGQVNRLKWLKRAMFGRAKFDLLRRRVLYHRVS